MALVGDKQKPGQNKESEPDSWEQWWRDLWDSMILEAHRSRIYFASFRDDANQELSDDFKEGVLQKYRKELLYAIKYNDQGEHYNVQTFTFLFARFCIFLLGISSGFVISNIFGAHINTYIGLYANLSSAAETAIKYSLAALTFCGVYAASYFSFRTIVPTVIRRVFEWGGKLGWHFWSPHELKIFRHSKTKSVKAGYDHLDEEGKSIYTDFRHSPSTEVGKHGVVGWKYNALLFIQVILSAVVGLGILGQTVAKSQVGMMELFYFIPWGNAPFYLAWSMGIAAFCVMLGQYTFTSMETLRDLNKVKNPWYALFRTSASEEDRAEVYLHNTLMVLSSVIVVAAVLIGMFNTSKVQGKFLLDICHIHRDFVSKLTVTLLSCAGKVMFTVKALGNLMGLIWAGVASCFSDKKALTRRNSEDEIPWWGFITIGIFAVAKSFTSVEPPHTAEPDLDVDSGEGGIIPDSEPGTEPNHPELPEDETDHERVKPVSKLYSPLRSQQAIAGIGVGGAFSRCVLEPLNGTQGNKELLPSWNNPPSAKSSPNMEEQEALIPQDRQFRKAV